MFMRKTIIAVPAMPAMIANAAVTVILETCLW
jgi:hypothetical protein